MKSNRNKGIVSVIGFEGPNRVGKGTQIARLYRYLEDKNVPCLIIRGSGSRPALGTHTGDPLSQWWFRINQSLKTTGNLDMWQISANRLAREYILWRNFFFPRILRRRRAQHGILLVDRTVLSQFMILRETGVTDWNKLYPDTAQSLGRKITGDIVCPDIIINLVASKETLLSRLDPSDPKHDFRKLLIETKSHWFLDTVTMLPQHVQDKIHLVGADDTPDAIFGRILNILQHHKTLSRIL